jgi:VanZ family protein
MLVLGIVYESLTPAPVELRVEQGDKVLHAMAYLALMSWFSNIYEGGRERLAAAVGCVALAVGLEFAQRLTATRTFEVTDMAASAAGVIAGLLLAPPRLPNYLHLAEKVLGAPRRDRTEERSGSNERADGKHTSR